METTLNEIAIEQYPVYKETAVEWLGEIPEHWNLIRGNYIFTIVNQRSKTGKEELLSVSEHYGVRPRSESNVNMFMAESYEGYKICDPGDLVINSLWAWSRGLGFSNYKGIVSTAYSVFRPDHDRYNKDYLNYLLRIDKYVAQYLISSKGIWISRLQLSDWAFLRIPVLTPPIEEQIVIAHFLDTKTALIDKAIAIKEKQIELLKERLQLLAYQAVTQGLNPIVKFKDTGLDWMQKTPEHWELKKLKFVVKILKRIANSLGYEVLSITQKGIKPKNIESGEGQLSMDYSKYQLVFEGEFAMNHMDLLTGYVDISKFNGVISPDYRVFDLMDFSVDKGYLLSLFKICYKQKIFYRFGQGVSQLGRWRFPTENFNNFKIPLPPTNEQKKISSFIESLEKKVYNIIEAKETEISKLKEYKRTLINSAVTGKIKVT